VIERLNWTFEDDFTSDECRFYKEKCEGIKKLIEDERAEQEMNDKIKKEVARQIKQQKR
jgi:hypothetical protein